MRPSVLFAACAIVACGSDAGPSRVTTTPASSGVQASSAQPPDIDLGLLRTLAVLTTGKTPTDGDLEATRAGLASHKLTIDGYIDRLLATDEFAQVVAPRIVLRKLLSEEAYGAPSGLILQKADEAHGGVWFLWNPCTRKQAVDVHPWWSLDETIPVCPDSYLPDQWKMQGLKNQTAMSCLAQGAGSQPSGKRCGCGPNLIRCFNSDKQREQSVVSIREELEGTVSYVTTHELPLETIFVANETWRDRNAEFVRRSQIAEMRHDPHPDTSLRDLSAWPEHGKWAPREDLAPGENAGVLTTPQLVWFLPDRRQRMTYVYDEVWCSEADSFGATPEALIKIKNPDIQIESAGWKELAGRPLCTTCHARLDYGMQFFWGFPNAYLAEYYEPSLQQHGKGPMFGRDINDPRGEAELTPHGFAQLAVAQPEFPRCMARDFMEWVRGNKTTSADIDGLQGLFHTNGTTTRAFMRAALQVVVREWKTRAARVEIPAVAGGGKGAIEIADNMHKQLEQHCLDCHDADASRVDLSPHSLKRVTVTQMLDEVAFGRMPKDRPLSPDVRAGFLSDFIGAMWSGPEAETAKSYYIGRFSALPAFTPSVTFDLVRRQTMATESAPWRLLENNVRSDMVQLSPGAAVNTGLEAMMACRSVHHDTATADRCISDALQLKFMINGGH